MKLPVIRQKNRYKKSIITFGGINRQKSFTEGEMEDASAISHRLFPAITQREKSTLVFECDSPSSALVSGKECIATDSALYYDRKKVADLSNGEKTLAVLGKKIIVFPDKLYYDTTADEVGDLRGLAQTHGAQLTFTENTLSVPAIYISEERSIVKETFSKDANVVTYETVSVKDGDITFGEIALKKVSQFVDGTIHIEGCKKGEYSVVQSVEYSKEEEIYTVTSEKIAIRNLMKDNFKNLREGDVVEIGGCTNIEENNKSATIVSKTENSLTFADETFKEGKENGFVSVQRKIPDFTCVCTYENRLWGCENNTIYASALGDATNFFRYEGISTDSYTVESNSAGDFTACTTYSGGCLFFKEDVCYRLFGNRIANFTLSESFRGGIPAGDGKSIAEVGGKLVYKGSGGVYVYYGGNPKRISDNLGDIKLENAVGGSDGKNYYLTAETENGREEFIWDSEKNLWSKSGIKNTRGYLSFGGDIYRLNESGLSHIERETDEDAFWSMTLRPFDEGYYKTKNYSRIHICAELFSGSYIKTEIKKDDDLWVVVNTSYGNEKKYINIPCNVKGCHEVQLRISGKGKSIINSIVREFSVNQG